MSLALASRKAALLAPWHRNPLWALARAVPSLDLRFADDKSLRDAVSGQQLITFTRASSATVVNAAGALETVASNVPRFDHNPLTGESLGLLVEESRTNSIRNNTMVGAVAGTPGTVPTNWNNLFISNGLSRQIVSVGTQAGISYIDIRYSGTASATSSTVIWPELSSVTVAATGQSWTASSWLALAAGSTSGLTIIQRVTGRSSVGGFLENTDTTVALSSTLTRYSASITMANASTARVTSDIALSYTSGSAIDITLRIGLPQLEQGAFATSVIPTSTVAATRSADVATDTTRGTALRSLFAQFRSPASGTRPIVSLDDNTANERIELFTSGTDPKLLVTDGGSAQADIDAGAITANTTARLASRFNTDNFAASVSGGAEVLDATGTMPTVDRIRIGRDQAGNYLNGTIARITGWNDPLLMLPSVSR